MVWLGVTALLIGTHIHPLVALRVQHKGSALQHPASMNAYKFDVNTLTTLPPQLLNGNLGRHQPGRWVAAAAASAALWPCNVNSSTAQCVYLLNEQQSGNTVQHQQCTLHVVLSAAAFVQQAPWPLRSNTMLHCS